MPGRFRTRFGKWPDQTQVSNTINNLNLQPGTFAGTTLLAECVTCPKGTACVTEGTVVPEPCPEGKYCAAVSSHTHTGEEP